MPHGSPQTPKVQAGPAAYGICQAGCAALVVACYAAAGARIRHSPPPELLQRQLFLACNVGFGKCSTACIAAGFAPTL